MNEGLIPRRYAKALYKVDEERKSAPRTYSMMQTLISSFDKNHALRDMVANPFVDPAEKVNILSTAAGAGQKDSTFADFLKLLVKNRRIDLVESIAHAYVDLYRHLLRIKRVEVVSAAPLPEDVLKRIKSVVADHLDGATMEFETRIDPDLIGGFIINIDSERLDASLRHSLKELQLSLLN